MNKKTTAGMIKDKMCGCHFENHGKAGMGYCMGFIGAAVYYISTAAGFWAGVLGVLKAIVWPAFLVYGLLKFLGM